MDVDLRLVTVALRHCSVATNKSDPRDARHAQGKSSMQKSGPSPQSFARNRTGLISSRTEGLDEIDQFFANVVAGFLRFPLCITPCL